MFTEFRTRLKKRLHMAREIGYGTTIGALLRLAEMRGRGVDLAPETVQDINLSATHANGYQASNEIQIAYAFSRLGLTGQVSSVLDVGCGKGGALIGFHRLGVCRLAGVDASERLISICQENLRRMEIDAKIWHQDAATFDAFGDYDFYYLFNPFPKVVLERFLGGMRRNADATGQKKRLLYRNVQDAAVFERLGFRTVSSFKHPVHTVLAEVEPQKYGSRE